MCLRCDHKLPRQDSYSSHEVATIFGVSRRAARMLIDSAVVAGTRRTNGQRARRVSLAALLELTVRRPEFGYILDRIADIRDAERFPDACPQPAEEGPPWKPGLA